MHNPPHPGEIIKELCIEPLDLTVTKAAESLGVTRKTFSMLLNAINDLVSNWSGYRRRYEEWLRKK